VWSDIKEWSDPDSQATSQDAWFALCKNTPGFSQKCPAWNASKLKETRIPEWRSAVCFVFCAYKQGFFTNKAVLFGLWRVLFFISMGLKRKNTTNSISTPDSGLRLHRSTEYCSTIIRSIMSYEVLLLVHLSNGYIIRRACMHTVPNYTGSCEPRDGSSSCKCSTALLIIS